MWKKYYVKRLTINNNKTRKALDDELPGLKKLIANDKQRIGFYTKAANDQWQILRNLKARKNSQMVRLKNKIEMLENQITTIKLKGDEAVRNLNNEIYKLKG